MKKVFLLVTLLVLSKICNAQFFKIGADQILIDSVSIVAVPTGDSLQVDSNWVKQFSSSGAGAPVYPLNRIPFGDGATAGGITDGAITFTTATKTFTVTGAALAGTLLLSPSTNFYHIGDYSGGINLGSHMTIDDNTGTTIIQGGSNTGISIGCGTRVYTIGDIGAFGNNTKFVITDAASSYTLNKLGGGGTQMVTADNTGLLGVTAIPTGTVTSVGSGYGLSGGAITTSGTLVVDSATLSLKYVLRNDTNNIVYPFKSNPKGYLTTAVTSVATGYGLSGGTITTTGTLLADTTSATGLVSKDRLTNTIAGLGTGTVTSVATGLGLSGGTITTTGTLLVDTASASILSRQRAVNTYSPIAGSTSLVTLGTITTGTIDSTYLTNIVSKLKNGLAITTTNSGGKAWIVAWDSADASALSRQRAANTYFPLNSGFTLSTSNKFMTASVTAADFNVACATSLAATPARSGYVDVQVNGASVEVGNGIKTKDCYFSSDAGTTAKAFTAFASGDLLYWVGSVAGYELAATDKISFNYIVQQ
jgi:autotransporter family porin